MILPGLITLLLAIGGIVYIFKPPKPKAGQKQLTKKQTIILTVFFGLLTFIFWGFGGKIEENASKKEEQTANSQSTQQPIETSSSVETSSKNSNSKEYQDLVLGFEKQILQVENSIKEDVANYDTVAEKFANKQASIQDTYTAANKAKKAYETAKRKTYELDVPKKLPQEVATSLEESKSKLSASYYSKENRMRYIMDFLDSNKSDAIEKANEQNTMARSFTMQSVTKLMEAKEQVGIKSPTQQK